MSYFGQSGHVEPVLWEAHGEGGIQGLDWHDESLRVDSEGDLAHSFFKIILTERLGQEESYRPHSRL